MKNLLYTIKAKTPKEEIIALLKEHPEIKFVSLVGIDLAGNDTDEKIPMRIFLKDIDEFYAGTAVQTDGSSVVLPGIATLNNAKVDMPVDASVNWFVDYNYGSAVLLNRICFPESILNARNATFRTTSF